MKSEKMGLSICGRDIVVEGRVCHVAHLDADDYKFLDDPEEAIAKLRSSKIRVDLFTFLQRLPDTTPKHGYPIEWDNMAVLPISTYENWWTKQIGFKARNKAKQAEKKGVVVREAVFDDDLVRGIWAIYNECPVRQERLFPHYGKSLEAVREMSATYLDSSVFIGAYDSGKLIGFIKLVIDDSGSQAGMMHIISMLQSRDKAPTNALVAHAVRSCADRHIPHLVYSQFAYGKKTQSSLSDFKERNGFQRVDIPRYYVPMTGWGKLALSMGLHHRLGRHLPESLVAKLREMRSAWYQRKFQLKPESL
jgi:hypothetical protein